MLDSRFRNSYADHSLLGRCSMAFEKFIPPQTSGVRPRATIRPSGLISFDAASVEAFGLDSAKFAVLYFDKTRKLVGIQIIKNGTDDGVLKLSRRRRSVSLKAPQFFDLYGLSFDEAQRFDVGHDPSSNMLTISLKNVQRRRGRRPKKS